MFKVGQDVTWTEEAVVRANNGDDILEAALALCSPFHDTWLARSEAHRCPGQDLIYAFRRQRVVN